MPNRRVAAWIVSLLLGLVVFALRPTAEEAIPAEATALAVPTSTIAASVASAVTTTAQVVRVVDGDTIVVRFDTGAEEATIRLLGINTPETVDPRRKVECFGKEASARAHALLDEQRVRLDEDIEADNIDNYGRLLRNIVLSDGTDVNALLVREGFATAYVTFPMASERKAELKKLENDARMAEVGLWSPTTCNGLK